MLVGKAPAHADSAVGEVHADALTLRRELEDGAFHVAHAALLQAGEAVRDDLRKHRNDAPGQVGAIAARLRFAVQRAAGRGEVAHVRDVYAQKPMLRFRVLGQRHRVVEVARVHRVDGDGQVGREVLAVGEVRFIERRGGGAGLLQSVVGELVGQVELADDRQRIHAGLAARAEDFSDDAFAAALRAGETQHLEHDFVFGLGALGAGIADVDRVGEDGAVDADIAVALALEVSADELARGAFEDLHDLAARSESAAAGLAADLDQHFVAR